MICPRCKQGNIYKGEISVKSQDVYICDECDAYWLDSNNISSTTFGNLMELYRKLDLDPLKNHVIGTDYKWEDK